jgi:hypothetical protein
VVLSEVLDGLREGAKVNLFLGGDTRLTINPPWSIRYDEYVSVVRLSGAWTIETIGYRFLLQHLDGRELVSFHLHPMVDGELAPHIHLAFARAEWPAFGRAHVPGPNLAFAAFIRFLIAELGVQPLRPDWQRTLA